jgi:hypothetical protein
MQPEYNSGTVEGSRAIRNPAMLLLILTGQVLQKSAIS